ncbi:hypothetical protein L3X38_007226 [Prunus dulcis]|uniref:Uncharacterized protein n=1 Tax=Prunus dulcis TaxID=3755 RepID=A0AAD5F5Q5_PRUDU|nr:hypothetical protein L3X38_007226 [Prunus dulcis]
MGLLCCFDGGNNAQRKEEDRIASAEALAKAAEAAQRRQEEFEKSAAGRAARAQQQAAAKQAASVVDGLRRSFRLSNNFQFVYTDTTMFGLPISLLPRTNTPDLQSKLCLSINIHSVIYCVYGMSGEQ